MGNPWARTHLAVPLRPTDRRVIPSAHESAVGRIGSVDPGAIGCPQQVVIGRRDDIGANLDRRREMNGVIATQTFGLGEREHNLDGPPSNGLGRTATVSCVMSPELDDEHTRMCTDDLGDADR